MAENMICDSCGGEFDGALAKCPFCGSLNISGAEAEYMEKLEDVHGDLEALKKVPEEEIRRAVRRSGNYLKKTAAGIAAAGLLLAAGIAGFRMWEKTYYHYDFKGNYIWKEENYPKMDRLYEEGKYEELTEFFSEASENGYPVYGWGHYDFCSIYIVIQKALEMLEQEAQGAEMTPAGYGTLLSYEWQVKWTEDCGGLTEEEREILLSAAEPVLGDFETRWHFSEESYAEMYRELTEREGYVSYHTIDPFAEKWYAEYGKQE